MVSPGIWIAIAFGIHPLTIGDNENDNDNDSDNDLELRTLPLILKMVHRE